MESRYNPSEVETRRLELWLKKNIFHSDSKRGGKPYCIVIPPPNITGILHMGHALNNTFQDVLIRWRRMQGYNTVWMPGTDHAGIATQNVVERKLAKKNITRQQLGREKFLELVWEWKMEYGGTIIKQLKRIGASCDWERERFTMDEGLSRAVAEVFVRLYNKKLIYRGNYIVNWCPRCQTALSDEESEHKEVHGKLYYIKYPFKDNDGENGIVVATTRPETLLGDVAVAVNPFDTRYVHINKELVLPVLHRVIPLIRDEAVDPEFGTGAVKVTPAHDPVDFEIAKRHNLETINVMNQDGTMNEFAGPYKGMDRFDCRKRIVERLEKEGLIIKVEPYSHSVSHCYRCNTVIEPRLSEQWFVCMKPLAEPAIKAVREGRIRFIPERWTKVYLEWMENIKDWCISRQIWWGHRIPVFYCKKCSYQWVSVDTPLKCPACLKDDFYQDPDVLDTWFSSWLWPFSTFGWPQITDDLKFYYPTNDLVTGSEIIFFWVARMIMAGLEFMGDIPFRNVYIHGTVRDERGRKMSKSLGNAVDPLDIVNRYSADALRFTLMMVAATGQDIYLSDDKFEIGRNFTTKLWNAARFIKMHIDKYKPDLSQLSDSDLYFLEEAEVFDDDKYIIYAINSAVISSQHNLEKFRFNDYAKGLYDTVWHKFCDWYIEYAKTLLYGSDIDKTKTVLMILCWSLEKLLRLLQPLIPFVTEEIAVNLGFLQQGEFLALKPWPMEIPEDKLLKYGIDFKTYEYVEGRNQLITHARALKADYGLSTNSDLEFIIKPSNEVVGLKLEQDIRYLVSMIKCRKVIIDNGYVPSSYTAAVPSQLGYIYMPLKGIIDIQKEIKRLDNIRKELEDELLRFEIKLKDRSFVEKAPSSVVELYKTRRSEIEEKLMKVIEMLKIVKGEA